MQNNISKDYKESGDLMTGDITGNALNVYPQTSAVSNTDDDTDEDIDDEETEDDDLEDDEETVRFGSRLRRGSNAATWCHHRAARIYGNR